MLFQKKKNQQGLLLSRKSGNFATQKEECIALKCAELNEEGRTNIALKCAELNEEGRTNIALKCAELNEE